MTAELRLSDDRATAKRGQSLQNKSLSSLLPTPHRRQLHHHCRRCLGCSCPRFCRCFTAMLLFVDSPYPQQQQQQQQQRRRRRRRRGCSLPDPGRKKAHAPPQQVVSHSSFLPLISQNKSLSSLLPTPHRRQLHYHCRRCLGCSCPRFCRCFTAMPLFVDSPYPQQQRRRGCSLPDSGRKKAHAPPQQVVSHSTFLPLISQNKSLSSLLPTPHRRQLHYHCRRCLGCACPRFCRCFTAMLLFVDIPYPQQQRRRSGPGCRMSQMDCRACALK